MKRQRPHLLYRASCCALILFLCGVSRAIAQSRSNVLTPGTDPRGKAELTVCSQNLENYGLFSLMQAARSELTPSQFNEKQEMIVNRFASKNCDIIAVQEVLGKTEEDATKSLEQLAAAIRLKTNRFFDVKVGRSLDSHMRPGFLFAKDKVELLNSVSYAQIELPKLTPKEKPKTFTRGPLEAQFKVKGFDESPPKIINMVNFHFKSKHGSEGDPTGLEYETLRMQMAEALRVVIENRLAQSFANSQTLLIVLGDRNANFDVASAKILEGLLSLKNFQGGGPCRLSKRGVPLCQAGTALPQKLFSVLTEDPQAKHLPGTFQFKGEYSWLDDIMMPAESLPFAWANYDISGDYDSGVVYEPKGASDHAMVWVRLNW